MPTLTEWLMQHRREVAPEELPRPRQSGWYKVRGMAVHMKGRDLPLPCARCRGISTLACDYPVEGGTCSAPLCAQCAKQVGPDLHLCPIHAKKVVTDSGPLL